MKEFELYLPVTYNDGTPIESRKIEQVGQALLAQFGGCTFFPQENEGFWTMGEVTFRDKIVIFRILSAHPRAARIFLKRLKQRLIAEFEQEEILIVEKDASVL